jgi:hypothetical protein
VKKLRVPREQNSKLGARSGQAGHHGTCRALQHGGDLLIGKLFILAQDDDFAEFRRKLLNGVAHPGEADDRLRISDSCLLLRLSMSKEFVVVLPVALDFDHDALEFGISADLVPVLVALKPGEVMISNLNGPSQPGES